MLQEMSHLFQRLDGLRTAQKWPPPLSWKALVTPSFGLTVSLGPHRSFPKLSRGHLPSPILSLGLPSTQGTSQPQEGLTKKAVSRPLITCS